MIPPSRDDDAAPPDHKGNPAGLAGRRLKSNKYRDVYAILRRREACKADVINMDAKWGLAGGTQRFLPEAIWLPRKSSARRNV
ncbi:MAG TPA: hypothetical protein VJW20_07770 [Candidatus Angelobacter sp.]|nr:hypothetical protein [Candidatus Angelobacter sp.]